MKGSLLPCPLCGSLGSVVDVRLGKPNKSRMQTRRRYECRDEECEHRWTTVEKYEELVSGEPSEIERLDPRDKEMINKMIANKLWSMIYRLRKNAL